MIIFIVWPMEDNHKQLWLHAEIRWLSKENVLASIIEQLASLQETSSGPSF